MSLTALGPDIIARRLYCASSVVTPVPAPDQLGPDEIARYRRDGFIAVENVFTPDEVHAGKDGIRKLIVDANPEIVSFEDAARTRELSPEEREGLVRKCMGFVDHEPRLQAMAMHPALLRIVRALVGTEVALLQDMALLKPPLVGREKPWHQDSAYFDYGPANLIIGTWTALDAATLENGCMHLIQGSHQGGGRAHYKDRDCQLPDETVDVSRDVAAPLKPGGVLFFSALVHHGTPPNRSAQARKAKQFHYRSVEARRLSLPEFREMFHDTAGVAGCSGAFGDELVRPVDSRAI